MYKHLPNTPEWLHSDTMVSLEHAKQFVISQIVEAEKAEEHNKDHVAFTSLHPPESELVKSGKFGPDIDEFSMLLPVTYPDRAGQQKYALEPVLTMHEKVISKLKTAALPSKLEDVRVSHFHCVKICFWCVFVCFRTACVLLVGYICASYYPLCTALRILTYLTENVFTITAGVDSEGQSSHRLPCSSKDGSSAIQKVSIVYSFINHLACCVFVKFAFLSSTIGW